MAQLPPQELENLMLNGMLMGEGAALDPEVFGAGGMPGQMPGEDMFAGPPDDNNEGLVPAGAELPDPQGRPAEEHELEEEEEEEEEEYVAVGVLSVLVGFNLFTHPFISQCRG
jgi:hypothetical protein